MKKSKLKLTRALIFTALLSTSASELWSQQNAEMQFFKLEDVQLDKGPFEKAMLTDLEYILKLDPDKLLAPFLKEAGLEPKATSYTNWENSGLDGHIGGHYLTALAQMYASAGSEEALTRLEYMLSELKKVQDANANGYIGGVPGSKELWEEISKGEINAGGFSLNNKWVPLYNIHKTYAGLRDAYLIAENELARQMLIDLTDWMLNITSELSKEQIQEMLVSEHGGLNEVFADVAGITGEEKYLELAYKFSHKNLLEPLASNTDILNGMHANTQIPKVIGFETIAGLDNNVVYHEAATYFWENVVNKRTVAIGGNSVREHFHPADDFSSMISSVQGPETCNTYNMLRLSEKLFFAEPDEKYIDYYEQALYNHILASQHPEKGGFVYFTPMRPGHYRVYSQPETSFWCCVGSGIENHGKYNQFIYTHTNDDLYVNLFIPSKLNWEEKGVRINQITDFPNEEGTSLEIETENPRQFNLNLRYPSWVKNTGFEILVNDEKVEITEEPGSFISISRNWKNGDKIAVKLPMEITSQRLPDSSDFAALKYGPILLGTKTGDDNLKGLFADDSRGGHIAEGKRIPVSEMPVFLTEDPESLAQQVEKTGNNELKFSAKKVVHPEEYQELEFIPFYEIHDSRYAIYLPLETPESYVAIQKERKEKEKAEEHLEAITIDRVVPGEQQPESDHFVKSEDSNTGVHQDRHWRDATGWFSYELKDEESQARKLQITYYGKDSNRKFKIFINGTLIAGEVLDGKKGDRFFTKEYILPEKLIQNKESTYTLKFEAEEGSRTAGVFDIRLMKGEDR